MINEGLEKLAARPITLRERALALFQGKTPEVRMSHLKTVEKTARGAGYGGAHFECELPGFTIEDLGPIDALGSRARNIISNGKKKYSTTFPKLWDEAVVCNKIGEAWLNPIAGTEFDYGFVGKTVDGMRIHMWLGADELSGAVFIKSAYPISEEKLLEIVKNIAAKKGK